MAWFDRNALPAPESAAVADHLGRRRARVLAWAQTTDGFAAGFADRLVVRRASTWTDVPWAEIVHGGWDPDASRFSWALFDGSADAVDVTAEHHLPELFRERVTASIAVQEPLDMKGARGVVIVARRNPADPHAGLTWHVVAAPGIDLHSPAVAAVVDPELERLKAEYTIA